MTSSSLPMPVVVLNDTRVDRHHGCDRVMSAIESLIASSGMRLLATAAAHSDWQRNESFLAELRQSRLVIVNGEGTIHHDRAAGLSLLRVAAFSRSLGIPSALVNCGWEGNGDVAFNSLQDFASVTARDSASAAEIDAAGIRCKYVPDLSLFLPFGQLSGPRAGVGFTDSVVRTSAVRLESLRRKVGGRSVPIHYSEAGAVGCYRYFREYVGLADVRSPVRLTGLLRARMQQFRSQAATSDAYLRKLANLRVLVSGRFHACTLALLAGTPFVAVSSNSRKIECLVRDAGLDSGRVVGEPDDLPMNELNGFAWSPSEAASVADYVNTSRTKAVGLFRDLRALG